MSALILDGSKIAQQIRGEVAAEVKTMTAAGVRPGLAVVLVGHDSASEIYVRGKVKACEEVGVGSEKLTPPESVTTGELLALIDDLNRRNEKLPSFGSASRNPPPGRRFASAVPSTNTGVGDT